MRQILCMLAIAGAASSVAFAGDTVVYTDARTNDGTLGGFVKYIGSNGSGTAYTFVPGYRLGDIKRGPGGDCNFVMSEGIKPPPPNATEGTGHIFALNDLDTTPTVGVVSTGGQMWNPIGIRYNAASNSVLSLDNTSVGNPPGVVRGLYGVNYSTGTQTLLQQERVAIAGVVNPTPEGRAWHEGGTYLTESPLGNGEYYVMAATGGRFVGPYLGTPNRNVSSTIWKVSINGTATASTFTETIDTSSAAFTRSSDPLTNFNYTDFRGLTANSNTNTLYTTSTFYGLIMAIQLDGAGNFVSSSIVLSGLNAPEAIEYDASTNTLVFAELGTRSLRRVNLDGSGLTTLDTDVYVRGISFTHCIIPTPGAASALALAGLAAIRRRR
jgi:hypothetical protein